MSLGDRSDALMHHLADRNERAWQAAEDIAQSILRDSRRLARLIEHWRCPFSLYFDLVDRCFAEEEHEGDPPTHEAWVRALDAIRKDGELQLPADVLDRLERYVTEYVADSLD